MNPNPVCGSRHHARPPRHAWRGGRWTPHTPRPAAALGLILLLVLPPTAAAQWTGAAYLGTASTAPARLEVDLPASNTRLSLSDVHYESGSFESPQYYGLRFGYLFGRFGIEGEVIHMKIFADISRHVRAEGVLSGRAVSGDMQLAGVVGRFSISHGLNLLLVNAVWRWPIAWPGGRVDRVALVVRAGAGPTMPHVESTIAGVSREGYELGRVGWQAAGGLEVRLVARLSGLLEYKRTGTRQVVGLAGGTARTRVASNHVVFGLGWRF